jgi:hypothetical protein
MGEPLANERHVFGHRRMNPAGFDGARHVRSTVGLVGIGAPRGLAPAGLSGRLLHAANDDRARGWCR